MRPPDHAARMERVDTCLEGLSVGDAFGERYFGHPGMMTARIEARELAAAPWTWTDDTAMALGVRAVLEAHGEIDQDVLAETFARNFMRDRNRGYGPKAQQILEDIARGDAWEIATRTPPYRDGSKGNGGAMRAGVIGAYFADDVPRLIEEARWSSQVTHAHPEGQAGAIAVARAAAWACEATPTTSLFEAVLAAVPAGEVRAGIERAAECGRELPVWQVATRVGAGERVLAEDTVPLALWCAQRFIHSYEEALWATVSCLGDRDTTCAIVGSIVVMRLGRSSIPPAWLAAREALG